MSGRNNAADSTVIGVTSAPYTQSEAADLSVANDSNNSYNKGRVSSVFQKVNGKPVMISEEAVRKGASFLSSAADSSSGEGRTVNVAAAPSDGVTISQYTAVVPSTAVGGSGRVSSIFQKVNGKPVVISEEAVKRSESFLSNSGALDNTSVPLVTPAKGSSLPTISTSGGVGNNTPFPVPFGVPSSSSSLAVSIAKSSTTSFPAPTATGAAVTASVYAVTPATPSTAGVDLSLVQDPALARDLEWFFSLVEAPAVMTPDAVVIPPSSVAAKPSPRKSVDFTQRVLLLSETTSTHLPHCLVFAEDGISFELLPNQSAKQTKDATSLTNSSSNKLSALLSAYGRLLKDMYERILPDNVDESLLSWLNMQLRWITWTLASYERRFPARYAFELLTVNSLQLCLQWRYDTYCCKLEPHMALSQVPTKSVVTPYTRRSGNNNQLLSSVGRSATKQSPLTSPDLKNGIRARQHIDAKSHFSKRGSMSPLQRSCDIACFVWPMVLCFSGASATATAGRVNNGSSGGGGTVYEVCDGWWWSEVKLDRELLQLVEKGLLRDGVKIAVFGGVFVAPQSDSEDHHNPSSSSSKHILHMNYNNVRLAHVTAKLGQIPPQSLLKGVSLSSTTEAGGPIFCIRGRIVDVSCVMSKIKRSVDATTDDTVGSRAVELNTILNQNESSELKKILEKLKQKTIDSLENLPELSMASLLDSYGCDDDVIEDFKKLENCEDSFLSNERMKELSGIKSGLEQHRHKVAMALMNAKTRKYHIDEARFVDILMECEVSKLHFWMRMMYRGDGDDDQSSNGSGCSSRVDSKFSLGSQFRIGNEIVVANVKRIHTTSCLPLVMCSSGSRIRVLNSPESKPSNCSAGVVEIKQQIITAAGLHPIASMRNVVLASTVPEILKEEDRFKGKFTAGRREVSFVCTIVDWMEQKPSVGSSDVNSVDDGLISIVIFAIDASRTCIEIRYSYPVELVGKISWLAKKSVIFVQYGVISQVDEKYDVIQVSKGDHTNVRDVNMVVDHNGSNGGSSTMSSPAKKTPKRKYDDIGSGLKTPLKDQIVTKEWQQFEVPQEMFENEHRRYQALRNNANQFQAYLPAAHKLSRRMIIEKCHRIHWNGVKVLGLEERLTGSGGDEDSQNAADSCGSGVGVGGGVVEYSLSFEGNDGSVMKAIVDSSMVVAAQDLADRVLIRGEVCVCNLVAVDCFSVTENRSISSQTSVSGSGNGGGLGAEAVKSYLFSNEYKRIIWLGRIDVV